MKTKKGKIVALASGAVVIAIGIVIAIMLQGKGYRSIVVEQANGQVTVTGAKNNGQAYKGEKLYSGDNVAVGAASDMVMCMDLDKYVYADEGTTFGIEASSGKEDSRLKLYLTSGSELNELKSKLGPNDSYQVDTPNSTMSVRGTTFRVTVYEEGGVTYTLLEVTEGEVWVQLKNADGTYSGEEDSFTAGQSALIRGFSEFVVGEENERILRLNYEILPKDAKGRVTTLIQNMDANNVIVGDVEAQEPGEGDDVSDGNGNKEDTATELSAGDSNSSNSGSDGEDTDNNGEALSATSKNTSATAGEEKHVHTPGEWVVVQDATCSAKGLKQKVCTECKEVVATEDIPVKDHVAGNWEPYSYPTCTLNGAEAQKCVYCGKLMATRDIPANGHSYSDGACTVCGESDPNYTPPAPPTPPCEHNWQLYQSNEPGAHYRCTKCGAEMVK